MRQQDWTRAKAYLQQALTAAPGDSAVRAELEVVEGKLGKK
jgi:Flp pilus assembly protein TadD